MLVLQTLCSTLQAQGVVEAEYPYRRDIERGRYDKVQAKLKRRLSRDTNNLECHYAAYRLYSDTSFPARNIDTAYTHLVRVRQIFASAEQKQLDRWSRDSYSGALFDHDLRRLCSMAMVSFAGLGVAMENAQPHLKSRADYITDTNDNDGVAEVIEKFILHEW